MFETSYHKETITNTTFLITGGAGFIGTNIIEYLLKYKAKRIKVLDNLLTSSWENIKKVDINNELEIIEGDITDPEVCQKAMEGVDVICHQAALGSVPRSVKNPINTNLNNVNGFINVLVAARDHGVKRMVYASSSSVYGDDDSFYKKEEIIGNQKSPYAVSKYANELYANVFGKLFDMELIGLRYFNVFGQYQSPEGVYAAVIPIFMKGLIEVKDIYIDGDGEQSRDFTFVENVVQANILALTTKNPEAYNTVFNIACGGSYTVNELYENIANLLGSDAKPLYRDERVGDIKRSLADISKAKSRLGYAPKFDLKEGLSIALDYYKNVL